MWALVSGGLCDSPQVPGVPTKQTAKCTVRGRVPPSWQPHNRPKKLRERRLIRHQTTARVQALYLAQFGQHFLLVLENTPSYILQDHHIASLKHSRHELEAIVCLYCGSRALQGGVTLPLSNQFLSALLLPSPLLQDAPIRSGQQGRQEGPVPGPIDFTPNSQLLHWRFRHLSLKESRLRLKESDNFGQDPDRVCSATSSSVDFPFL